MTKDGTKHKLDKGREKETIISKMTIAHNHYMATVNMQEP